MKLREFSKIFIFGKKNFRKWQWISMKKNVDFKSNISLSSSLPFFLFFFLFEIWNFWYEDIECLTFFRFLAIDPYWVGIWSHFSGWKIVFFIAIFNYFYPCPRSPHYLRVIFIVFKTWKKTFAIFRKMFILPGNFYEFGVRFLSLN